MKAFVVLRLARFDPPGLLRCAGAKRRGRGSGGAGVGAGAARVGAAPDRGGGHAGQPGAAAAAGKAGAQVGPRCMGLGAVQSQCRAIGCITCLCSCVLQVLPALANASVLQSFPSGGINGLTLSGSTTGLSQLQSVSAQFAPAPELQLHLPQPGGLSRLRSTGQASGAALAGLAQQEFAQAQPELQLHLPQPGGMTRMLSTGQLAQPGMQPELQLHLPQQAGMTCMLSNPSSFQR